jgi:aspartate/methionine/tyrosine aminotransferase
MSEYRPSDSDCGLPLSNVVSAVASGGAVAALTLCHNEVANMRAAYQARRDVLVKAIEAIPELGIVPPSAGIFCMVDVSGTGLDGEQFADELLEQEMVSVLPGGAFSADIAGYVRLSLCEEADRLTEAAARLARFVSQRREASTGPAE